MARILVADDDADIARMIKAKLGRAGHECTIVFNGADALKQVGESPYNLIVLDVMMPGMDGFEVLRRIKANLALAHIPCIMLTARSHEKDVLTGLTSGAVDYVRKPFSMNELIARIENHVGRARNC